MMKRRKMLKISIITAILLIVFFAVLYIMELRSEPYNFALKFINTDKTISENLGLLKSRRLAFFGFAVRYSGPRGHAEYKILVKGEKGEGEVYLQLEKSVGIWRVVKGNLVLDDGRAISLVEGKS